jgi:methionine-S-sulfoxide reductase
MTMTTLTHRWPFNCRGALAPALVAATILTVAVPPVGAWSKDDEGAPGGATETAILAGGCFWGMEDLLRELDGVLDTEVGYATVKDDRKATPAEAVRIVFDPTRISYEDLLRFFFRIHDPTTANRQGNDRGAQYRSSIFVLGESQRATAERVRADVDASGFWKSAVVTEINPAGTFEEAAEHHQDYLEKNPGGYTCHWERGESSAR